MPGWLIALLKWGGLALAAINLGALVYVAWIGAPPSFAEETPDAGAAPYTVYVLLIVAGIAAAVAGFALERRGRTAR